MKIAITGASGFLGKHLLKAFLSENHHVHALLLPGDSLPQVGKQHNFKFTFGDLSDSNGESEALLDQADIFLHLAAIGVQSRDRNWHNMCVVNTLQPLHWLEKAKEHRVGKIIAIGTSLEYSGYGLLNGTSEQAKETDFPKCDEFSPLETHDGYGATKAAGGLILRAYARENDVPFLYLRLASMYGPDDDDNKFFPAAQRSAIQASAFPMTWGGQVRDWLHVDDAISAIQCSIRHSNITPGDIINIGTGFGISLKELAEAIFLENNSNINLIQLGKLPYRKNEKQHIVLDPKRATKIIGWSADIPCPFSSLLK